MKRKNLLMLVAAMVVAMFVSSAASAHPAALKDDYVNTYSNNVPVEVKGLKNGYNGSGG